MITFDPPELQDRMWAACGAWAKAVGVEPSSPRDPEILSEISEDLVWMLAPDDDAVDGNVNLSTLMSPILPQADIEAISVAEFLELAEDYAQGDLADLRVFSTPSRRLFYITPCGDEAHRWVHQGFPEGQNLDELKSLSASFPLPPEGTPEQGRRTTKVYAKRFATDVMLGERRAEVSITFGLTAFALAVAESGQYEEYHPPYADGMDQFVEVRGGAALSLGEATSIALAFLFEISTSLGLDFSMSPRPVPGDAAWFEETNLRLERPRLRPLLMGRGIHGAMDRFASAIASPDAEAAVLRYSQALEHVSQTVVRLETNEVLRKALLSPRALAPDADYIRSLEETVRARQQTYKDSESMKATIRRCCRVEDLATGSPPFLRRLSALRERIASSQPVVAAEAELALDEFAAAITATRNAIAHAKANYTPKGPECPASELGAFVHCLRLAAEQAIRWFAALADADRQS